MPTLPMVTATRQFASLVLAPVDGAALERLRTLLADIRRETLETMKGRPLDRPIIPFKNLDGVHYARFVLLEHDATLGPQLAFSTNYDGPEGEAGCSQKRAFDLHVQQLVEHAGLGLERVFACCQGYRPGKVAQFIRKKQRSASTFYVGSSGRSRNQIVWEAELRSEVDRVLDAGHYKEKTAEAVRTAVLAKLEPKYSTIPTFDPQPDLTRRITAVKALLILLLIAGFGAIAAIFKLLGLGLAVLVAVVLAALLAVRFRRLEATDWQFQPEFSPETLKRFDEASRDENEFLQNQLTHLVRIKPGPIRWLLIRVVFAALDLLARNRYNKGTLGGIPSIHFARWVLIPNRGVLFFSNFDSSWQNYLGDFIDKAGSGLTAVWSNTEGYPRTKWLLTAGSRDAARFLAWARQHQLPTQVWYSAYPGLSVVNVNANTEIRRGLADPKCMDAATWLFHLRAVDRLRADQIFGDERQESPLSMPSIQGIILWGYGHMPEARYLLFRVKRPGQEVLDWLSNLPLTSAEGSRTAEPPEPLTNVAFSYRGLRALGVDEALCQRFSTAFVQGSDHPYRARVNGDVGEDAPERWEWGSELNAVHLVLLIFGKDGSSVERYAQDYINEGTSRGLELVKVLEGTTLPGRKEHFGFRDGIAQPTVQGSGRGDIEGNTVAAGEFLLGHRDGYGNVAHSPASSAGFAFGHNGSYLVFRQLEQNVEAFWRYCEAHGGGVDDAQAIASKLVGRWPSGATLVRHPKKDPESPRFADEDAFTYLANDEDNDRYGARCPFGAHIRRANPRDWQLGATPEESLELSNLHRILRRGRPYGAPLDASMAPSKLIEASQNSQDRGSVARRGLQFLCFNTNIDRQFEFIQQQWCGNPKFAGQNSDADPLLGMRQSPLEIGTDPAVFTLQSDVKTGLYPRAMKMERFVRVVGSTYFFMPSLPAVKLLRRGVSRPLGVAKLESPPADEQLHVDSLIDTLRDKMKRDYEGQPTLRDAHPKMHGCVKALFKVEHNLSEALKVGVFREPKTYQAWVRFSNQAGTASRDTKKDIRGAAIKLLDVGGDKLLEGAESGTTQDFILISTDVFVTRDVAEFDGLIRAMVAGPLHMAGFLLTHLRVAWNLIRSMKRHASPLEVQYFSVVPYLFGSRAVKYSLRPTVPGASKIPVQPEPDYLRGELERRLAVESVSFDFLVQMRPDTTEATLERTFPIEDPGVSWPESDAPFIKVATLEIQQEESLATMSERHAFGENLSFNPWRCLAEHRPLGGISRARRQVYRTLSAFRHDRNAALPDEPKPW